MTDAKKVGVVAFLLTGVLTYSTGFNILQAGFVLNVPLIAQVGGIRSDAILALAPVSSPVENSAELVAMIVEAVITLGPAFDLSRTVAFILSLSLATAIIVFRRFTD